MTATLIVFGMATLLRECRRYSGQGNFSVASEYRAALELVYSWTASSKPSSRAVSCLRRTMKPSHQLLDVPVHFAALEVRRHGHLHPAKHRAPQVAEAHVLLHQMP